MFNLQPYDSMPIDCDVVDQIKEVLTNYNNIVKAITANNHHNVKELIKAIEFEELSQKEKEDKLISDIFLTSGERSIEFIADHLTIEVKYAKEIVRRMVKEKKLVRVCVDTYSLKR